MTPTNLNDWNLFFQEYKDLSTADLAALAECSVGKIRSVKRKLGIEMKRDGAMENYAAPRKADSFLSPTPEEWDNREWFYEHYVVQKLGKRTIARIIGRSKEIVFRRLDRYNIPHQRHTQEANPFCNGEWLVKHYCRKRDYIQWCEENELTPHPAGGMGLPLWQVAEIAGVNRYTIYNWLSKFGIYIRSETEAKSLSNYYQYCDVEDEVESRTPQDSKISG